MANKKIVLTGGGSTGHVSVNLALIPILLKDNWDIHYIGSKKGIERELIEEIEGVDYIPISTGKLRRYLSFQNILDVFRVLWGIIESIFIIFRLKPDVIFSKGGFVSVPVLIGGWVNRVPSISHESDLTPGLANKLVQPFVDTIFTTFPETENYIKSGKGKFLGPVIREGLFNGNSEKGKEIFNIKDDKPLLLVMGGSLGAKYINDFITRNIDKLTEKFNIVHVRGNKGLDSSINKDGYYQYEYIKKDLNHLFALTDVVLTRSGSNAIFEFLFYKIPMILIPLPTNQSRGDQIDNARSFQNNGFAEMFLEEDNIDSEILNTINEVYDNRDRYIENMNKFEFGNTIDIIYDKINEIKK